MYEKIKEIILKNGVAREADITLQTDVKNELGYDSLELLELRYEIEEEFNITIEDEEFMNIKTIQDIVDVLESKL